MDKLPLCRYKIWRGSLTWDSLVILSVYNRVGVYVLFLMGVVPQRRSTAIYIILQLMSPTLENIENRYQKAMRRDLLKIYYE